MATEQLTPFERFERFVSPEPMSGCWLWTGYCDTRSGYGTFRIGPQGLRKAHRFAYEFFVGPIAEGLVIDHLCRVRCCVNPQHLEPVTDEENQRRGHHGVLYVPKSHCPQGHPLAGDNLYEPSPHVRMCKTCRREAQLRWLATKVA